RSVVCAARGWRASPPPRTPSDVPPCTTTVTGLPSPVRIVSLVMNAIRATGMEALGADQEPLLAWTRQLIDAVNADNEANCRCDTSASRRILGAHPPQVAQAAALALADFARAGHAPLTSLRSDTVAQQF